MSRTPGFSYEHYAQHSVSGDIEGLPAFDMQLQSQA